MFHNLLFDAIIVVMEKIIKLISLSKSACLNAPEALKQYPYLGPSCPLPIGDITFQENICVFHNVQGYLLPKCVILTGSVHLRNVLEPANGNLFCFSAETSPFSFNKRALRVEFIARPHLTALTNLISFELNKFF